MTDIAARNRAIKKTLAAVFGKDKVTVRGARGTAYGYVDVNIDIDVEWEKRRELSLLCKALLRKHGIGLGHAYTDDTCETVTDQCSISFR